MVLLRRHMSFYLAAAAGGGTFALGTAFALTLPAVIAANVFFAVYICLSLWVMSRLNGRHLSQYAASADAPAWIIFAVVGLTVALSVGALFLLVNQAPAARGYDLIVALIAIPLGWATIHLMSATHYAHVYWGQRRGGKSEGGVEFPKTNDPTGWDFVYFALTIGMTAQTADTALSTTRMRRLVTLHAVLSFFFNTVIVAAAVNVAVSLGK